MRHGLDLSKLCFAIGMAGIGVLSLIHGDFALQWQPVPKGVPWREGLAYVSGVFLLIFSVGLLWRRTVVLSALALTLYVLSWVVLLQAPRAAAAPSDVGAWLGFFENLALASGAWIFFAAATGQRDDSSLAFATGARGIRIATFLFAISLPVFGLSHLMYADFTASMVPAWLPQRVGLAYLTGAAHIAAGLAILLRIVPRLAASLEAVMMGTFVLLVHLPGVAADPASRLQWTMLFVALALTGSAWAVANALAVKPHGLGNLRHAGIAQR